MPVEASVRSGAGRVEARGLPAVDPARGLADPPSRETLERGLLELASVFLQRSGNGMDGLINQALARMGELTGTDRAYLFDADRQKRSFRNTHEWTAPGIDPVIDLLQDVRWDVVPDSARLLAAGEPVVIPRVDDLGEDVVERAFLESQGIRSLLIVPVMQGDVLMGFVGFDSVRQERDWSSAEVRFLQVFASLMVSAIERERAYAAMIAAKERETIGHMASGVAHDFNNLLGVIDANLYYLQQTLTQPDADPEIEQILEETYSALGQAKVVTSGMLSLSRNGGFVAQRVVIDDAVEELVRILRHVLPPEIRLRLSLEPGLAAASNAGFLQAALLNLVLNARDAMPNGGDLVIESSRFVGGASGALVAGAGQPGEYLRLRVTDTGCGMAPEVLARLFEPLFSTKARQQGHGLGLFMVHEFALRSGARLEVDSRVGEGSEFRLLLRPWAERGQDPAETAPVTEPVAALSLRVLMVDDDPRCRDSVRRLLEIAGARVEAVEDGLACLERLRRDPGFDLVLSDVSMPLLDGAGLCAALFERHPLLPVILMTGQTPLTFPGTDVPGNPIVLRKPLELQDLYAAIAGLNQDR